MTEMVEQRTASSKTSRMQSRLRSRYAAESRFRMYGMASVAIALSFLALLFFTIVSKGATAFVQSEMRLEVQFDAEKLGITDPTDIQQVSTANYPAIVRESLYQLFPEVTSRSDRRQLMGLASNGAAYKLREMLLEDPSLLGKSETVWVPAASNVDMVIKGHWEPSPTDPGPLTEKQTVWMEQMQADGSLELGLNTILLTRGDSREPELAGVWGAVVGSFYSLLVTLALSFPLGVATAVYLEEFAPKNKWTDMIEVNINNLAAVPSIVFGLLGLAVFLGLFGMPRSAPLVGGLVLTLMSLPTIIIAARAALKAVPPSIREAALGLGASRLQVMGHHVLPLAMPGILTGTIIAMAQALGESAPLLMIGMVAFIVDIPASPMDPSAVLPVQVYLWADSPERGFTERTSAAIMVLLFFLALMNAAAVLLRKKFERRW